ncbi:MAG: hypothetical protein AAF466_12235 [Bacteroidota bacterium]
MKETNPSYRFVAWSSPEALHSESLGWVSEMEFSKDEQVFLTTLMKDHILELLSDKLRDESQEVLRELNSEKERVVRLLQRIAKHGNALQILVDGVDQLEEEAVYKKDHYQLKMEVDRYFEDYRKTKRTIFRMIKQIIRNKKRKKISK